MSHRILPSIPGDHDIIALVAHQLWDAEGRPSGRDLDHWLEAERQVLAHRIATATEWSEAPWTLVPKAQVRGVDQNLRETPTPRGGIGAAEEGARRRFPVAGFSKRCRA